MEPSLSTLLHELHDNTTLVFFILPTQFVFEAKAQALYGIFLGGGGLIATPFAGAFTQVNRHCDRCCWYIVFDSGTSTP